MVSHSPYIPLLRLVQLTIAAYGATDSLFPEDDMVPMGRHRPSRSRSCFTGTRDNNDDHMDDVDEVSPSLLYLPPATY